MSVEDNKAVVRAFVERVVNGGDESALPELVAEDCEIVGWLFRGTGPEIFAQVFRTMRAAMPDYHLTIDEMVAEGDTVVIRVTDGGTHAGPFLGVEPTGKRLTIAGVNFVDVRNGKITRSWGTRDRYDALRQLGALE